MSTYARLTVFVGQNKNTSVAVSHHVFLCALPSGAWDWNISNSFSEFLREKKKESRVLSAQFSVDNTR